ncbi:hypothetical protein M3Y98_00070800 [Aphelenchoides besseyi]|nr:hypothetical protein M3Y98_00070800 [Aphelenchoides besseyi]
MENPNELVDDDMLLGDLFSEERAQLIRSPAPYVPPVEIEAAKNAEPTVAQKTIRPPAQQFGAQPGPTKTNQEILDALSTDAEYYSSEDSDDEVGQDEEIDQAQIEAHFRLPDGLQNVQGGAK